jgi:hypothetical protein
MGLSRMLRVGIAMAASVAAIGVTGDATAARPRPIELEFLGQQVMPTRTEFAGTEVGGLSSLAYDAFRDVFYAISDDQGQIDPVRFYTLRLDLSDGVFDAGDVHVIGVTTLLDATGQPFAPESLDPEGIALTSDDQLVISSEGIASRQIAPFVRLFGLDGRQRGELPVPDEFLPTPSSGVRQNLGFESVAVNGHNLFVGTEGALVQDGPPATVDAGSPARILRYRLNKGDVERQILYVTDPIAEPPVPATSFAVNGLVELLPLNNQYVLSMERSFSLGAPGTGNTIRIYLVKLAGADDINDLDSLAPELAKIRPARKTLVLDLDELGIPLDNVEGMAFGPELADGRRTLLLASDNNFSPTAFTQFLVFALESGPSD